VEWYLETHVEVFLRNFTIVMRIYFFFDAVCDNQNKFFSGLEVHGLNATIKNQIYLTTSNLSVFQKGTMFTGTRLFNL
jgi:hypothetical protein